MCYLTAITPTPDLAASPIRALHSLTAAQVSRVAAALRRMPDAWSLDQQEGYDGDLTLVITPQDESTDLSYALWRTPAGFHLCAVRGDDQVSSDILPSLDDVLQALPHRRTT